MMKVIVCSLVTAVVLLAATAAWATPVTLGCTDVFVYVDSAPNGYGSPDYPGWEADTFAAVIDGTFVNMSNGVNPANVGTHNFEIQDEVVYSFGDLGKRLHWIYWIPDTTIADLTNRFKVALYNDWGTDPTLDFYLDRYGSTWLEPTKWIESDEGVIGTAGMAWWPDATQEAVDAAYLAWGAVDETWTFKVQLDGIACDGFVSSRTAVPVPEPVTMVALTSALIGLGGYVRRRTAA